MPDCQRRALAVVLSKGVNLVIFCRKFRFIRATAAAAIVARIIDGENIFMGYGARRTPREIFPWETKKHTPKRTRANVTNCESVNTPSETEASPPSWINWNLEFPSHERELNSHREMTEFSKGTFRPIRRFLRTIVARMSK